MDEALSRYLRALSDPEIPVSISDVEKLMKDYPYFTLPAVTLLRREGAALPSEVRRRLLAQAALNAPDPTTLAMLTDPDSDTWLNFYPPEKKAEVTTENVIDTFLATYGHSSPGEDALLERLIFNPATPDYSALLAQEEEESLPPEPTSSTDPRDALINAFILKNKLPSFTPSAQTLNQDGIPSPPSAPSVPSAPSAPTQEESPAAPKPSTQTLNQEAPPKPSTQTLNQDKPSTHPLNHKPAPLNQEDTSLTESLAKIYIRRHRYDKAFEIIHNLSLKNPKKSVYFADQLRFLRKLMLNSSYNDVPQKDSKNKINQ